MEDKTAVGFVQYFYHSFFFFFAKLKLWNFLCKWWFKPNCVFLQFCHTWEQSLFILWRKNTDGELLDRRLSKAITYFNALFISIYYGEKCSKLQPVKPVAIKMLKVHQQKSITRVRQTVQLSIFIIY